MRITVEHNPIEINIHNREYREVVSFETDDDLSIYELAKVFGKVAYCLTFSQDQIDEILRYEDY